MCLCFLGPRSLSTVMDLFSAGISEEVGILLDRPSVFVSSFKKIRYLIVHSYNRRNGSRPFISSYIKYRLLRFYRKSSSNI